MAINFFKYQGAGNDFIIIDNRKNHYQFNQSKLKIHNNLHSHCAIKPYGFDKLTKNEISEKCLRFL